MAISQADSIIRELNKKLAPHGEELKTGEQSPSMETIMENRKYVIVRTYSAGVFAGYLESRNGKEVVLKNVRRLWHWEGAATLSQLAQEGVSKPMDCKFPTEVDRIELLECIEILDVTEKAKKNIANVPVWVA